MSISTHGNARKRERTPGVKTLPYSPKFFYLWFMSIYSAYGLLDNIHKYK